MKHNSYIFEPVDAGVKWTWSQIHTYELASNFELTGDYFCSKGDNEPVLAWPENEGESMSRLQMKNFYQRVLSSHEEMIVAQN